MMTVKAQSLIKCLSNITRLFLVIVNELFKSVSTLVPELFGGAIFWIVIHRISYVCSQFNRKASINRHQGYFELSVNWLKDPSENGNCPKGLSDVGSEDRNHWRFGSESNFGKT